MISSEELSKYFSYSFRNKLPGMNTWYFSGSSHADESQMLEYINKRTGQSITLKKSIIVSIMKMLIPIGVLGILLYLVISFRWIIAIPIAWLILACIVFIICCGGTVHIILHNVPFTGHKRTDSGEIESEYIATGVICMLNL